MDERPPGWYRDPDNAREHRYWNGQGWQGWLVTQTAQTAPTAPTVRVEDEPESE